MHADKREEIKEVYAGDIVACVGLRNTTTGDTLCDDSRPLTLEQLHIPEPVVHIAVEPKARKTRTGCPWLWAVSPPKIPRSGFVRTRKPGRPLFPAWASSTWKSSSTGCFGSSKCRPPWAKPQVAYRETITKSVEVEGRHIKQTGGRGQFGHVWLRLEPGEPGSEVVYETAIVGGSVPRDYWQAVGRGVKQAATKGSVAGFPVTDLKVILFDGSYHDVDSSEMAFSAAGVLAVREGLRKAGSVLLEPLMEVEVVTPEEFVGEVMGDLSSRRGRVKGLDDRAGVKVITADVPLATMFGYATRSSEQHPGTRHLYMQFGRYEQLPESVLEDVLNREKRA